MPKIVVVHHTADNYNGRQFDKVNRYHQSEGYWKSKKGFWCFYVWFIEKDGSIIQAREEIEDWGSRVSKGRDGIDVCFAGNFNAEVPTPEQEKSGARLLSEIRKRHDISPLDILPHRKFAPSDCYGSKLNDNWATMLALSYEITYFQKIWTWLKKFLIRMEQ